LIIDDVIAIVDAGTGCNFEMVKRNLDRLGVKMKEIELLINTHCHFDHIGGNRPFLDAGSEVAIHELEADYLRNGEQFITQAEFFGERLGPMEVKRELRGGDRIELGELVLEVVHTPGHTRGSICLYEPRQRMLFSGDTVFCDGVGRTDLPTGSQEELVSSLLRLSELKVERLYPGHGPYVEKNARELILEAIEFIG
jgi:glyoxylase-like metal-dependent hydrolase (beta-lactamase superfamily II)